MNHVEGMRERAIDAYYAVTRPFRPIVSRARWTFFRETLEVCARCGATALWQYVPSPGDWFCCDDCVSRGCDCQIIDKNVRGKTVIEEPNDDGEVVVWIDFGDIEPEQRRDHQGRLLPCCEYDFHRWGWPKRQRGR